MSKQALKKAGIKVAGMKLVTTWEELSECTSETHYLKISLHWGHGWIEPKDKELSWGRKHYLSTHTFYGRNYKHSTRLLQRCGFNVILANWDEVE